MLELAPLTLAALAALPLQASPVDHEAIAKEYVSERCGLDPAASPTWEQIVDARLDRVELGLVDVYYPREVAATEKGFEHLRASTEALLGAQVELFQWVQPDKKARSEKCVEAIEALETMRKWAKVWRQRDVPKADEAKTRELVTASEPHEDVLAAQKLLRDYATAWGPYEIVREGSPVMKLVLAPTREEFVGLAFARGLVTEDRSFLWVDGLMSWSECWFDGARVLALQYAATSDVRKKDWRQGTEMGSRNPNGLAEQVAQIGLVAMLEGALGERTAAGFRTGVANNVVIAIYEEVDTRTDGDVQERSKTAYGGFVNGGKSSGGTLPAADAGSRWRVEQGKDHFIQVLHDAQQVGYRAGKRGDPKHVSFELQNENESERHVVRAPFLGNDEQTPPPEAFLSDYAEFLRAYRSGFLYWLRHHAAGKKVSPAKFAELLVALATPDERSLDDVAGALYEGAVFSDAELEEGSLEGRFLLWLVKQ